MSARSQLVESRLETDAPAVAAPYRVLILRSCRPAEFSSAVRYVRAHRPGATVVALSHRGHGPSLAAAGVDDVIELSGTRFGLTRIAPWRLLRLRAAGFDEVVVPQMTADMDVYYNLHRVAFSINAPRVTLLPGAEPPQEFDRAAYRRYMGVPELKVEWRPTIDAVPAVRVPRVQLPSLPRIPWASWRSRIATQLDKPWFFALMLRAYCVPRRPAPRIEGRKVRVLHIITSISVGGAQRQLFEVINHTPADRYDVDLLVFSEHDGQFSRQWLKRDDVRVMFLSQHLKFAPAVLEIAARCREGRYDLVHTWLCQANAVAGTGARLAGVPRLVIAVRNLNLWKAVWYKQWWYRPSDILSARIADVVTVNARALVADHSQWTGLRGERITVVHNGLDPSKFLVDRADSRRRLVAAAGCADDAFLIGAVGRMAPEKDHRMFLRVFAEVYRQRPHVHGIVIGDGALRAEMEQFARDLGISRAVSFLGERSDVLRLTAGLDLFLLPSVIEGFPNALLEAVFMGVPALSTNVGGCPDVLGDPGATFAVGDDATAVAATVAVIDDPATAAARAAADRTRALELFTAERTTSAWLSLYSRCLED